MSYQQRIRQLGIMAHFIGPPLLLASTLFYVADVGRNLDGFSSYVEGVVGVWTIMFFVPIFLMSAELVGRHHVKHGIATAVIGVVGAAGAVFAMSYRVVVGSLEKSGLTSEIVTNHLDERATHWELLAMAPATISFPATSIVIGAGLVRLNGNSRPAFAGPLLIAAGIAFLIAQGTELNWALNTLYPASALLMTMGYATIGRYLLTTSEISASISNPPLRATT